MEHDKPQFIVTTRPIFRPHSEQSTLRTSYPGLSFRSFQADDLNAFHELRSQIEVMRWTSVGKVDADLQATKTWMGRFMKLEADLENTEGSEVKQKVREANSSPNTFNQAIMYGEPSTVPGDGNPVTPRVIGAGGCHFLNPEPECGYMIRKEYWGQGIATAFLTAFLEAYWNLERKTVRLAKDAKIDLDLLKQHVDVKVEGDSFVVQEYIRAVAAAPNTGSRKVLEKCNFKYLSSEFVEEFGEVVELTHWVLPRPLSHLQ